MKLWQRYREHALTGEWHAHTSYTHGENTVDEMCEAAVELGIPLIAFTEHVRREMTYDWDVYVHDVEWARVKYEGKLIVLLGFEAKILPDGTLDAPHQAFLHADHVVASVHGGLDQWHGPVYKALQDPRVCAWGHPGRGMAALDEAPMAFLTSHMALVSGANGVAWETPTQDPHSFWKVAYETFGSGTWLESGDSHSVEDLKKHAQRLKDAGRL